MSALRKFKEAFAHMPSRDHLLSMSREEQDAVKRETDQVYTQLAKETKLDQFAATMRALTSSDAQEHLLKDWIELAWNKGPNNPKAKADTPAAEAIMDDARARVTVAAKWALAEKYKPSVIFWMDFPKGVREWWDMAMLAQSIVVPERKQALPQPVQTPPPTFNLLPPAPSQISPQPNQPQPNQPLTGAGGRGLFLYHHEVHQNKHTEESLMTLR